MTYENRTEGGSADCEGSGRGWLTVRRPRRAAGAKMPRPRLPTKQQGVTAPAAAARLRSTACWAPLPACPRRARRCHRRHQARA
jgi:hypothetical protein